MIEYIENHLEECPGHKDVFSWFHTSESTNMVSEAVRKQLTIANQEEQKSDPAWKNISTAAKCRRIDDDTTRIESDIGQHLIDES